MIEAERLETLRGIAGEQGVVEHEPVFVDGVGSGHTLRPADGGALSGLLAELSGAELSVWVRGGGERTSFGNTPTRIDAFLSTERMHGIDELDASDGVCRVLAGTRIDHVRETVSEAGWEFPLEPPGARSTVGGCIAAGAIGPRSLGHGTPRAVLLGLDVCVATGARTRCGGRVVKNVTGYDLNKLYTGSFGTLGVIESAWLRLLPKSETARCFDWETEDLADASRVAIEASRRATARAAALVRDPGGALRVVTEFAGDSESVRHDSGWLADQCAARAVESDAIDALRERQAAAPRSGLRFRIGVLPSRLEATLRALDVAGAAVLAYPGLRVVYAGFTLAESRDDEVGSLFDRIAELAKGAGGDFACEAAPTWAKRGRDMFGGAVELVPIHRALKHQFDPSGVLNPGRFVGSI